MDILNAGASQGPFPLRYLGFGFFWTWLFLVGVSPSPLFGDAMCVYGIPFEAIELAARSMLLLLALAASRLFSTRTGVYAVLGCSFFAGTFAAAILLVFPGSPAFSSIAALLAALADTCMFLLWLSFFGYMRLGDALAMLVLSYAAGSVLFLAAMALGRVAMTAAAVLLPAASTISFLLSAKLHASQTGSGFFNDDLDGANLPSPTSRHAVSLTKTLATSLARITICLGVYAFVFAVHCSVAYRGHGMFQDLGPIVEPACMVVLAIVYLLLCRIEKRESGTYALYRTCAPLIGLGLLLDASGASAPVAFAPTALGYVTFEVLALNDYCNIVQAGNASLFKFMARARLAISLGMVAGWAIGLGLDFLPNTTLFAGGLFLILLAATQLFGDNDICAVNALAEERAAAEEPDYRLGRTKALDRYAETIGLSPRETEVLSYLVEGRTTSYIATRLYVAESTVRAHVHNVYQKAHVNSRMGLLDDFESYYEKTQPHCINQASPNTAQ